MNSNTAGQLFPLREIPKHLPRCTRGRPIHTSTVYRWALNGKNGVRLETVCVGRVRCTSLEALGRFFSASSAKSGLPVLGAPVVDLTSRRAVTQAALADAKFLADGR